MRAGEFLTVLLNEIVRSLLARIVNGKRDNFILAIAREIRDHPQLSKCVHHVPPNQQMTCWAFAPLGRERSIRVRTPPMQEKYSCQP